MRPKVSVIVTNYNYEKYLEECIESVLMQDYDNIELIIVDDGSTDNSKKIIKKYTDKYQNVKSIFKSNSGMTDSFSAGFMISTGNIICTLDSDDYYFPNMIRNKVEKHLANPNSAIVDTSITADGKTSMNVSRTDVDFQKAFLNYGYIYSFTATSGLSFTKESLKQFMPLDCTHKDYGGLEAVLVPLALTQGNVTFDFRLGAYHRTHLDYNVRKERYHSYNNREYYYYRYELHRAFYRSQLEKNGINIPKDDFNYYRKIVKDVVSDIGKKGVVIYGTSEVGEKCAKALEELSIPIKYYADAESKRIWGSEELSLKYTVLNISELLKKQNEYNKILIGSRQSTVIKKDLIEADFSENKIISLPL